MEEVCLFELKSLYRDSMRVKGFRFGSGEDSVCIVGSMRGNEVQQLYCCSRLVAAMRRIEEEGRIADGRSVLIVPCVNTYSMNTGKRFWPTDNSDINRMYPGYSLGETTQRIAAGVFEHISGFRYGIQFASNYIPGRYTPHVRMMVTGFEDTETAKLFGLPYVMTVDPMPFDTVSLNYNWQIWETKAYSVYARETSRIDVEGARTVIEAVLRFMDAVGVIDMPSSAGAMSDMISRDQLVPALTTKSGIFEPLVGDDAWVTEGQPIARVMDPYDGTVREEVLSPCSGKVFFMHAEPLVYADTIAFWMVPNEVFASSHQKT